MREVISDKYMKNKKRNRHKLKGLTVLFVALVLCMESMTGCGRPSDETKVVLTTGFRRNEVFRIEDESCTLPEIMVYLTNIQNRYEKVYGSKIWETEIDGVTLEENVKETALAKMAQTKAMKLLAKKHNIELTEQEKETAQKAAEEYFNSLSKTEIEQMGIDEKLIASLYEEYALSDKLYQHIIKDINPEISDDEARTITVEHILIKTYSLNENGEMVADTEYAKSNAKKRAQEVLEKVKEGENFEDLATQYSEDDTIIYSFGKGEMEPEFEEAAFNLGTDEVSDIVETRYGYHIIKCLSTFNREVTDENKKKIVEKRKEEVFGEEYETFVDSLTRNLNRTLWESVTFIHDKEVTTSDFFEVYDRYFSE